MHQWIRATAADFTGTLPQPRSGHTAVNIGKSKIVIFGGFVDKRFVSDIVVYDIENNLWFQPECTGCESDGHVGPSPRAFHVATSIDCHMFIFGGRSGSKRLGDFWVLDTDIWQWSELTGFGDLPSPRDFAAASAIGNRKIVLYGGWDGRRWMSDVYVMDTISLEWMELAVAGTVPTPRCGHTATMLENGCLYMVAEAENEEPGWTQLKLPGQAPSPRCGHTVTFGGHYLLMFGGHGTGGWLSRYDLYYNDCVILDRVSVQWKRLPTSNEPPPARAYHSMTCMGSRYLLFGGFDGKTTFGDLWWLVPEDDPIAKRYAAAPERNLSEKKDLLGENSDDNSVVQEREGPAILELERKLNLSTSVPNSRGQSVNELEDKELLELAYKIVGDGAASNEQGSHLLAIQALRDHWRTSDARSVPLKELGPLLRDYKRLIAHHHLANHNSGNSNFGLESIQSGCSGQEVYRFYHIRNASQLRMVDIPRLLEEYKQLPCA